MGAQNFNSAPKNSRKKWRHYVHRPVEAESVQESGQSLHEQENGNSEHGPDGPGAEDQYPAYLVSAVHRHRHLDEEVPQHL